MAIIAPTITTIANDGSVISVSWASLTTTNNEGTPISAVEFADRSVTFHGIFGVGGTIKLQGSNLADNTVSAGYFDLTDPQGNAISKTSGALEALTEIVRWVKPVVTAGDGTTSLTATLILRRANTMRT